MKEAAKRPNLTSLTTINSDGSHYVLHPADTRGKFKNARQIVGVLLLLVYVALPWIPINGSPALFFDVENRRFHIFGLTMVPQDLWVVFFLLSGLGFSLFFVTALLGRLWCGWACPYTVFLEHVFRRVERWIDGDRMARMKLDAAPMSAVKLLKRVVKQTIYVILATAIAHVFLSYFVSMKRLYQFMQEGPMQHATAFTVVIFLSAVLWFCFAKFREQFCIMMCPYGRLQSALSDDDTFTIGYDGVRGEPRGAKGKTEGACIDCRRCVQVCPTGIDIRNGLQLECIGCAACIDACDEIMDKVGQPRGLVRYDSFNGFSGKKRRVLRPRIYVYGALMSLGALVFGLMMFTQARPFNITFGRVGSIPYSMDNESVRNLYQLRVQNKRNQAATFSVKLKHAPAGYQLSETKPFSIQALDDQKITVVAIAPRASYTGPCDVELEVTCEPGGIKFEEELRFLGPDPDAWKHDAKPE